MASASASETSATTRHCPAANHPARLRRSGGLAAQRDDRRRVRERRAALRTRRWTGHPARSAGLRPPARCSRPATRRARRLGARDRPRTARRSATPGGAGARSGRIVGPAHGGNDLGMFGGRKGPHDRRRARRRSRSRPEARWRRTGRFDLGRRLVPLAPFRGGGVSGCTSVQAAAITTKAGSHQSEPA
jgi:hypothetical protein